MLNRERYALSLDAALDGARAGDFLRGRKVLITGATGLIGSFLVDALLRLNATASAGVEIHAAGRSEAGMRARFGGAAEENAFHYVPYDAREPLALDFAPDLVIHAATNAHPLAYSQDPVGVMQANLTGTMNLLEALRALPEARMILLSTGETYGENPDLPQGFSETDHGWIDPMNPRACYPESKRAAETLIACYRAQYGVDARVARLCHVYGPTFTASNSRADAQFIRRALCGEDIVLKSTGAQVRSWCYVADAAAAILALLARGAAGQAYNVANRNATASIREYAATLARIAGVSLTFDLPPDAEKAGYTRVTRAVLNPAKLEALGWEARYGLEAGLTETFYCSKA